MTQKKLSQLNIFLGKLKLGIIEERPMGPTRFIPTTTVSEIASNFKEKNIGSAPIVDMEDNFLGVLSERDMAIKLVAEGRDSDLVEAKEIMRTENLAHAYEHHTIDYAINKLKKRTPDISLFCLMIKK